MTPFFFVEPTNRLFEKAADLILATAKESVRKNGRFVIALSGGKTPAALYDLLALKPYADEMPWEKTYVFWGDERHVSYSDPENNAFMAKTRLADKVPLPSANVFPVPVHLPAGEAASTYEETIISFFGREKPSFDMILLGLGADGHTASLFTGSSVINEKMPGVRSVFLPEKKMYRITMTAPLINMARNILFLVTGKDKAGVLATVLSAACDPARYPACLIRPLNGNIYWFADPEAASRVERGN